MGVLETGIFSEKILCATLRMTLGVLWHFALRAELVMRGVVFSRNELKEMLDSPEAKIMCYNSNISLSRSGPIGLEIHLDSSAELQENPFSIRTLLEDILEIIDTLKDIQKERSRPVRIILQSFWLRRPFMKSYFLDFLKQAGLTYEVSESGELGITEYIEHASLFSYKQFKAIRKIGSETGTIFIPGGKDRVLTSLLHSSRGPQEIAREYNQHHGLRQPY
ncbi:hypothetical protein KA050_01265 [Candidatus Gracilibacteria bacterium]|nr:hypothetical protein [Candidatus Gracilibacteria bacterium]